MDPTNIDDVTLLIPISGIPTAVRDTRQPYEKQLAIYLILASTLFERIAFYSLAANFAPSLQVTDDPKSSDDFLGTFIFSGVSYISTLIFAILSDFKLRRGRTIIVGFILYLAGYIAATIVASMTFKKQGIGWTDVPLIIIAMGAGAVKSNLAVFGAEQIQESKITSRYFDKYFVAVNIGIILATLVVPNISYGWDNFFGAYLFATFMIFIAGLLFIIGYQYYIHVELNETVVSNCIPVILNAFQSWRKYQKIKHMIDKGQSRSSRSNLLDPSDGPTEEELMRIDARPSTFLDFAKGPNGGKFPERIVNDVKSLRKAFFVFTLLIPYWLIYSQLYTTFPAQGGHMKGSYPKYVVFWMTLGDPITIIIGILILNMFGYKYLNTRNWSLTMTTKFLLGMFLASITVFIAGGVEVLRQKNCHGIDENSTLSVYTELLQTIFMGFSELFATVACFEFAYFAAPRSAQSLFMSLYYCTVGLSAFIGTGYIAIFSAPSSELDFSCPPLGQKSPHLYNYFFVLAGVQLFFVLIFFICQYKFQIIRLNLQQVETNQFLRHSFRTATNR